MIQEFVNLFMGKKHLLEESFKHKFPDSYASIVQSVVELLKTGEYGEINSDGMHVIDDGDYQGTQLFIFPERCYQPSRYWAVYVSYGSCSGCDTLEGIRSYSDDPPDEDQINQLMTLALHIVQGIKEI